MPLFEQILNEEEIKKEIKLNVISLVGKICFRITKHFIPYFKSNMNILLLACDIGVLFSEGDFDFEDYLQNLRYTLVSTFTLFFYGLDECGQAAEIEPYISQILTFFSTLIKNDAYDLKAELLKGMLGFIMDMIATIGRNIKKVIDPIVLQKLLFKIKETKQEKLLLYAKDCEEDMRLIWNE